MVRLSSLFPHEPCAPLNRHKITKWAYKAWHLHDLKSVEVQLVQSLPSSSKAWGLLKVLVFTSGQALELRCLELTVLLGCRRFAFKSVVDVLRNETSN